MITSALRRYLQWSENAAFPALADSELYEPLSDLSKRRIALFNCRRRRWRHPSAPAVPPGDAAVPRVGAPAHAQSRGGHVSWRRGRRRARSHALGQPADVGRAGLATAAGAGRAPRRVRRVPAPPPDGAPPPPARRSPAGHQAAADARVSRRSADAVPAVFVVPAAGDGRRVRRQHERRASHIGRRR